MFCLKTLIFGLFLALSQAQKYDHLRFLLDPNFNSSTKSGDPIPIIPPKCADLIYETTPPSMCDKHMELYANQLGLSGTSLPSTWAMRSKFLSTFHQYFQWGSNETLS